jgi:heterodisulfide reductase subunit B
MFRVQSFGLYTETLETWKEFPEKEKEIRDALLRATGRTFEIPKNLVHASDLIYKFRKEISSKLKYRLVNSKTGQPLKVVDHIGCHYAKIFPKEGNKVERSSPYVLAGLIDEWGGSQVDYPERRQCCGFGFRQNLLKSNRSYSFSIPKKSWILWNLIIRI